MKITSFALVFSFFGAVSAMAQTNTFPSSGNVGIGTTSPAAKLDVVGGARFTGGGTFGYTASTGANNGLILGTVAKASSPSGGQGAIQINSNDASNPLQGWVSLITDPTATNRRLTIAAIEQNVSWRDITLAEGGGNVGIGTSTPFARLAVVGMVSAGSAGSATAGNNTASLVTSSTKSQLYLTRSIGTWGDTWWEWTHDNDNKLKLGFSTVPQAEFANGQANFFGNVGIGNMTPSTKLEVNGNVSLDYGQVLLVPGYGSVVTDGTYGVYWQSNGAGAGAANYGIYRTSGPWSANNYQQLMVRFDTGIVIDGGSAYGRSGTILQPNGGNVGIGTTNPTQKLSVNGTIRAKEVIVDTGWSDYVFDENYRLAPLSEVERQIKAEKHLPGIPSAMEVADHGVSMGDMQSKLLAKIEELTLHQIAQEKELNRLREKVTVLESAKN